MQRASWGLFFILCISVPARAATAIASSCFDQLKDRSQSKSKSLKPALEKSAHFALRSLRNSAQVFINPYTFPIKLARTALSGGAQKVWANRVDFLKDGAKAAVGYLIYGLGPGSFILSIADFHNETDDDFLNIDKNELIVVVNAFAEETFMDQKRKALVQILAQERQRAGWNVEIVTPKDELDLAQQLNKIRKERGPIARLDIYSHGSEKSGLSINQNWLNSDPNNLFFFQINPALMSKNAVVRINSCLVGKNKEFLERLGSAMMPQGGRVYASKLMTVPSGTAELTEYLAGKDMPAALDQLQNILVGKALNVGVFFYLQGENLLEGEDSLSPEWNPIQRIDIE